MIFCVRVLIQKYGVPVPVVSRSISHQNAMTSKVVGFIAEVLGASSRAQSFRVIGSVKEIVVRKMHRSIKDG